MFNEFLQSIIEQLLPLYHNPRDARQVAFWLLEWVTKKGFAQLVALQELSLTQEQEQQLFGAIHQHLHEHKPLQYIIGSVPFVDLEILVKPPVLIPRVETEEWVYWLINMLSKAFEQDKELIIADIGTGTGCIALALAKALPQSTIYALDIADEALTLAEQNAKHNNIENIIIKKSNLFSAVPNEQFDLIVSNPPYISEQEYSTLASSVKAWEDKRALAAGKQGLAIIEQLIQEVPKYLKKNSPLIAAPIPQLVIEIDRTQGQAVLALFEQYDFAKAKIKKDLFGNDRIALAWLA